MIKFTTFEGIVDEEIINLLIPSMRHLLQTIQLFNQMTNKTRIFHKTRVLLHINFFKKISMKNGTFNIHLVNVAIKVCSKIKN